MMFIPLVVYLISFNFSSLMLGVKLIRMVLMWLRFFIWSRKLSVSLYMLLHSTKDRAGQRLSSWYNWLETFTRPPNLRVLRYSSP